MKTLVTTISFLALALPAYASEGEVQCPSGQVKTCYHDGDCQCKERVIPTSHQTPSNPDVPTCVDDNDDGSCD